MRCPLVVVLLLFSVAGGHAQSGPAETTPYRHYATSQGVPHENILALAQGADHRLYAGTLLGLAVYNGERVETVAFPDSIPSRAVHDIVPASDGTVWASVGARTVVQVKGQWVHRAFSVRGGVEALLFHRDTLYVFTGADGYWTLANGDDEPTHHPYSFPWSLWRSPGDSTSGRGVEHATVAPDGQIWIVDGRRGPGRLRSDGTIGFAGVPEAEAKHWWKRLQFVDAGTALLTRSENVYQFDVESGAIRPLLSAPGALVTYQGDDRLIYAKGDVRRGLPGHEELRSFSDIGIPVPSANHALVDHEGSLWLGTKTGLFQLYAQGVRHRRRIGSTTLTNVGAFARHADSTLWAKSWGSGLIRIRPDPTVVQPRGESRWTHVAGGSGSVQSLSATGWYRYEGTAGWQRIGPFRQAIRGVAGPSGHGYFWHDDGLYHHPPGDRPTLDTLFQWPTQERDYSAVGPHQRGGFVFRVRGQLYRAQYPQTGSTPVLQPLARLPGYEHARGRFLQADRHGRVWLAFWDRGLVRVDPRTSPPTVDSLLVDRRVRRVTLSGDSLALVTALDGLYLVDADSFRLERHLTSDDGLLGTTTGGATFFNDTLYVSHQAGITMMPRRMLSVRSSAPRVLLTSLEREGTKGPIAGDSAITGDRRAVAFNFAAPTFRSPGRVRYEYRLAPRADRWRQSKRGFASYTNLPPGEYQFEVRARLENGPVGPSTSYAFRIPRQYYETTWFQLLGVLALLGMGVGVYRWRVRQLRRRKDELEEAVDARTEQLRKEKQTTEEQAQRLAELDEAKNRFFANVSHEFRTPLTLISGPISELLSGDHGALTDAQAERLRMMQRNANRLLELIEQLLDLARLDAEQMELDARPANLIDFLERRIRTFEPLAERQDISLHFRPDADQLRVSYDPEKLRKVLDNLLSNALGFTPEEGDVWLSTRVRARQSSVDIVVKDTGPGISEGDMKTLFDRFEQSDEAAARQHEGAGIGLALARDLVELHGGSIRVRSEPGYGAAFIVRLPVDDLGARDGTGGEPRRTDRGVAPDVDEPVPTLAPHDRGPSSTDRSVHTEGAVSATVLIVDDNAEVRMLLRDQLGGAYEILDAANGRTGLEVARREQPDLIISDVMMPEMDGFALCDAVKSDEELAATPVLLLTAKAGSESEQEGLGHGADAYVAKPFDTGVLRARVENLLTSRRRLKAVFGKRVLVESSGEAVSEETASLLDDVLAVVDDHLGDAEFSVEDLAAEVALSRRQLSRRLKEATGESPGVLIRRVRLNRAAQMFETGAPSVSEVAYAVGYESPSHFARAFRKRFGCAPSEYEVAE